MVDNNKEEIEDIRGKKRAQATNYNYGQLTFGKFKNGHHKISLRTFFGNPETEVFAVKFNETDQLVASSCSDGSIKVFDLQLGNLKYNLSGYSTSQQTPTTAVKWKPKQQGNVLLTANADGTIMDWGMKKGHNLNRVMNPCGVFGLDYNSEGNKFAAVGKDFHVRIYDDEKKTLDLDFGPGGYNFPGHSNRLFSAKFVSDQPHILLTAGWDSIIQIWDLRDRKSVGQLQNVTVSSDSLDQRGNFVLAGCYRNEQQIMIFDLRSRELVKQVLWDGDKNNDKCYCYAAQFSDEYFLVGATGQNEVKIYDIKKDYSPCASIVELRQGVYAADWSQQTNRFAFAGGEGVVYIMGLVDLDLED